MTPHDTVKQVRGWDPGEGGIVLITPNTPREFVEMVEESGLNFLSVSELRIRRPGDPRYIGWKREVS